MTYLSLPELRAREDALFLSLKDRAIELTNQVVDEHSRSLNCNEFHFSLPASRNIYQSGIFQDIHDILLLETLSQEQNIRIETESEGLFQYFKGTQRRAFQVSVHMSLKLRWKLCFKPFFRFLRTSRKMWQIARLSRQVSIPLEDLKDQKELILVDTYMLNGFYGESGFTNRYYGSFFDFFSPEERQRTYLVPNFLPLANPSRFASEFLKNGPRSGFRMLCKESCLGKRIYFDIFLRQWKSYFLSFRPRLNPYSVLIFAELRSKAFSEMSFEAWVSYEFIRKISKEKLQLQIFLNWNENHLYDRAYAKGFSDFMPWDCLKGYQCVVLDSGHDFYITPTQGEKDLGLFPRRLALSGRDCLPERKECLQDIQLESAPIFRMKNLAKEIAKKNSTSASSRKVLVGLSLVPEVSKVILDLVLPTAQRNRDFIFSIRQHPLAEPSLFETTPNIEVNSSSDLYASLRESRIFVGTGSSLVLEAALFGVFCLIPRKKGTLPQNPIPLAFRRIFTQTVQSESEVEDALRSLKSLDNEAEQAEARSQLLLFYVGTASRENFEVLIV